MRILISYLFCTKGGVETALLNRFKASNIDKYAVDLHFFNDYGGSGLFKEWKGCIYIESRKDEIKKIIEENQYGLIITIDSLDILELLSEAGYTGKIGLEVHTTYKEGLRYLNGKQMKMVDFIIVPSKYQRDLICGRTGEKKIFILGNAISESIYYRPKCVLSSQRKIILWVGRIDEHKNWRLFLQIAAYLKRKNPEVLFWAAGGLRSETVALKEFEKNIYQLDLQKNICWIPQAEYKDMGVIYSYAANSGGCYISTSQNESFGMTVIEAMKCRCAVIVNDVGALREIVGSDYGMCIHDMGSQEHMEQIRKYIFEEDKTACIDRAEKYADREFSSQAVGKKFAEIVDAVI